MANEAWQYTTGPVHLFARFVPTAAIAAVPPQAGLANATTYYLGTAEQHPIIRVQRAFSDVFNDIGGRESFDLMYEGERAYVFADVNRFQRLCYEYMSRQPRWNGVQGENDRLDVGSLMVQNGLAFQFIAYYSFYNTINAAPGLPPGYFFYACALEGPDDVKPGTKVESVQIVVRAQRVYSRATRRFGLYSQNPAFFQGLEALIR